MLDIKILAGGALLAGAGFWFFVKPTFLDETVPPVYTEEQIAEAPRPTVALEDRVLNLRSVDGSTHYLKLGIALEFADPDHKWIGLSGESLAAKNEGFAHELEPEMHRIWDVITTTVGDKTLAEVGTTAGVATLKRELRTAINSELHHESVENVFFTTFLTE